MAHFADIGVLAVAAVISAALVLRFGIIGFVIGVVSVWALGILRIELLYRIDPQRDAAARAPFTTIACHITPEYHLAASSDGFQCLPFTYINGAGDLVENVTDWSFDQFNKHYRAGRGKKGDVP